MGAIVPAVLPQSREDLEQKLALLSGFADSVQIDVVDGTFASPASWPYVQGGKELAAFAASGQMLPQWGTFAFEIDLMVGHPEEVIGSWVELGASRITVHAESTAFLSRLITDFDTRYGHDPAFSTGLLSLGLAINLASDMALIEPFVKEVDYVQFMGIAQIGRQGAPFDARVLDRVRTFRKRHPDVEIQVDGGASRQTAPALLDAGVDRLIVGSALLKAADPKAEFTALNQLTEEYGVYE